MLALD
jgi:hypothetical protein